MGENLFLQDLYSRPRRFTLKTIKCFPSKLRHITRNFGFVFQRKIPLWVHYGEVVVFEKAPFSKCFPTHTNVGVLKFLRFEERFRKAPFS